eukprot:5085462-Ditylum_brightwellii.AAC.1
MELGGNVEKDEMKGLLSELMKASTEIHKAIHHLHVAYELYHKKGHFKDKPANKCNKKIPVKTTPFDIKQICGGISGRKIPRMCVS